MYFSTMRTLSLLSAFTLPVTITASQVGDSGTLSSLDGGLGGVVTVVSNSSLKISKYELADASAPELYWWGSASKDLSSGFRISNAHITQAATSDSLTINLDAGHPPIDFDFVGLWCEKFKTNFGQAELKASGTSGDLHTTTGAAAPAHTTTGTGSVNAASSMFVIVAMAAGFAISIL
ncbi:uncharacterized protein TrAFT101_006438 [Trichoderma asperellum]|uniref:DM13 domain-containing protein n=1 Tax=Trichoderma asperellum (strain ATCC 204424 / CBS 433.97 / NBRC 101777) TaxID=1042311 RepID=A0A2T3YR30_TRIA4|nr:hypothetical protein M441DRAFT_334885 [Trichoderma asperellum CBS 433.97]PTB35022.1 hypothetical protein M441DRAFT_334885 [Trichoderma asperellum CBS 433.97]UKZ91460.1 hypothetical protein TrAFT101_006438 [Trichoderma asperellum]